MNKTYITFPVKEARQIQNGAITTEDNGEMHPRINGIQFHIIKGSRIK